MQNIPIDIQSSGKSLTSANIGTTGQVGIVQGRPGPPLQQLAEPSKTSGVRIIPNMAKIADHLSHFISDLKIRRVAQRLQSILVDDLDAEIGSLLVL